MDNLKAVYRQATDQQKLDFLRWAIANRPQRWNNLARQLGFANTESAFDINLASQSIKDENLRQILATDGEQVKIEVKGQPGASESNNAFIETWCRGKPSGISVTESEWFALPLGGEQYQDQIIIIISTERLRRIMVSCYKVNGGDNHVAHGYLVPIKKLVQPNKLIEKSEKQPTLF